MKKINILYIVSSLKSTGPTNQLYGLISELNFNLFNPEIITLSNHPENSRHKDFEKLGIKVSSLNLSKLKFLFKSKYIFRNIILDKRPDVIHTSGIRADFLVSNMNIDIHCMTVHNFVYEDYINTFGNILGKILSDISISIMKKCKYVICCSETIQKKYLELNFKKNIYSIQNGIEVDKFMPVDSKEEKRNLKKYLDLDTSKKVIIIVGNLVKGKDPFTIINAFNESKINNLQLVFLGTGNLIEECIILAKNNKDIKILGSVNNVADYLRASDVYLSASLTEGLPMSVLEASSVGLTPILSDIEPHKEIFKNFQEETIFFPTRDIFKLSSIFKEIDKFDFDTNTDLSDFINRNFSNSIMANKYMEMYRKISNSQSRREIF